MSLSTSNWKNKCGTSDRSCTCETWKAHWENFSTQSWPSTCSVEGCDKKAEVGAHIYQTDEEQGNKKEWIAPFCKACNGRSGTFNLKNGTKLVSANKSDTCEKNT